MKKLNAKQVSTTLTENKDFIATLMSLLNHYGINSKEEVEEVDYLLEPYMKLEKGKTVVTEFQKKQFELKRVK